MHTGTVVPYLPQEQDLDIPSKLEGNIGPSLTASMAVCQPIVSAKETDGANAPTMEREGKVVAVTPEGPKNNITLLDKLVDQPGSITSTSGTTAVESVSMDRSDDDEEEHSQADSSDGESSYFVKHLPSPKSGRRFSEPSATPPSTYRTSSAPAKIKSSDASLSFSDESDDEDLPLGDEPEDHVPQLPSQVADMQLQRITRVHSVSSLVSSNSSNCDSHPADGVMSPESTLSDDNSVNAEHSTVVATGSPKESSNYKKNQAMGNQYHQLAYPTMHQQYNQMTNEQMSQWMAAQMQHQPGMTKDGRFMSDGTLPFVYSDDEADDMNNFMHHLATEGGGGQGGTYNSFSSNGGGGGARGGTSNNQGTPNGGDSNMQPSGSGGRNSNELRANSGSALASEESGDLGGSSEDEGHPDDRDFQVYWQRWIMLFYMSLLNLLSDWTCYSVAPIAILTKETFGDIDPERLVVIFLGANAISTACEPIILARLGLKKTVLLGALFLMIGSMVKSGGIPPFIEAELHKGQDEWRLSLGFFLVGLSQPLYQCTPALLSASWFPEQERTMATGVALNANQLGIGCAFVFGTLLVATSDDIPSYFGLLSMISTLAFFGTLIQFDDAPPTPPSSSAKVIRGDITVPDVGSIMRSVRDMRTNLQASPKVGAPAPSPGGLRGRTAPPSLLSAPSPMMPGPTGSDDERQPLYADPGAPNDDALMQGGPPGGYPMYPYPPGAYPPQSYQNPYGMPGMPPGMQPPPPYYQQQPYYYPPMMPPGYQQYGAGYPPAPHPLLQGPGYGPYDFDEGAEPVVTISDHHLDINIRDDQVILSIRACLSRPGFIHSLVSFVISGIVINTLSTYMDYLVTLNGAGREMVGIIGGSFQGIIMMSSLIIGSQTDKTRAYYSVIMAMLVLGAFGLAQAGVSLDADRGNDLRYALLICAALIGPLQPVSTELGVEVAYPLSENTVLVIQQLFSNLLSALFIPFFKALKDIGISGGNTDAMEEKPEYTFSFYLLILLHAGATVFFATFNGRYLRYEHELEKEAKKEQRKFDAAELKANQAAGYGADASVERSSEGHPLL